MTNESKPFALGEKYGSEDNADLTIEVFTVAEKSIKVNETYCGKETPRRLTLHTDPSGVHFVKCRSSRIFATDILQS